MIKGFSVTQVLLASGLTLNNTWNDAGTVFTGVNFNVTDTASSASSLLLDLQVGGSSRFSVSKSANALFSSATFRLGAADAAAPVAQTFRVQNASGAADVVGATLSINASAGTGNRSGGDIIFNGSNVGSGGGTTTNPYVEIARMSYYSAISQYGFYINSPGAQNNGDVLVSSATRNGDVSFTIRNQNNGASAKTIIFLGNSGTGGSAASSYISLNGGGNTSGVGANSLQINSSKNLVVTAPSGVVAFGTAALATSATTGYLTIPSCAGLATGVPSGVPTGQVAFIYDSTNKKLGVYDSGWIWTAALT